jgi:hypothetical protein
MALPASGAISLSAVNTELGLSATAAIGMNDSAVRTLFGVASGAIGMGDGYGKANGGTFVAFNNYGAGSSPQTAYKMGSPPTVENATSLGGFSSPGYYNKGATASNGGMVLVLTNFSNPTGTNNVLYSTDGGANWSVASQASNNTNWGGVAGGYGGLFVAACVAGSAGVTRSMYCSDTNPASWTITNTLPNTSGGWTSLTASTSGFYIVGSPKLIYKTTDGANWSAVSNNLYATPSGIAFGNGKFMTCGTSGSTNWTATSSDCASWTTNSSTGISTATFAFNKVLHITGSTWIGLFTASSISVIARTTNDGASWSTVTTPDLTGFQAITNGTGTIIINGGNSATYYMYSTDAGASWTKVTTTSGSSGTNKLTAWTQNFISKVEFQT